MNLTFLIVRLNINSSELNILNSESSRILPMNTLLLFKRPFFFRNLKFKTKNFADFSVNNDYLFLKNRHFFKANLLICKQGSCKLPQKNWA